MPASGESEWEDHYERFLFQRLLTEVYLLLDFISGKAEKSLDTLSGVRIPRADQPPPQPVEPPPAQPPAEQPPNQAPPRQQDAPATRPDEIISYVSTLRYPPEKPPRIVAQDAAFLLLVKDKLNQLAFPANGMTVALTTMFSAPGSLIERLPEGGGTRPSLAAEAYPGLVRTARWLRWTTNLFVAAMLIFTLTTVYIAGVATIGRALVDRVDESNRLFLAIADQIKGIENSRPVEASPVSAPTASDYSKLVVRLCQRRELLAWQMSGGEKGGPRGLPQDAAGNPIDLFSSAAERQLCDQQADAEHKQKLTHAQLHEFLQRHLWLFHFSSMIGQGLPGKSASPLTPCAAAQDCPVAPEEKTYFWLSAVLAVIATYVLPMCFTLLGTGVSILRDLLEKVRRSILAPRDLPLSFGRLALGIVAGAAIGLFFSPTQVPMQGGGFSGQIMLSASGLAFLAGYGVDAVFTVFDNLLHRLSAAAQQPPNATAQSPSNR